MTARQPPRQYAVYVGKNRKFPKGEEIVHGGIYKIHVSKPDSEKITWTVLVDEPKWQLYVPYPNMSSIWADWIPYNGEVE